MPLGTVSVNDVYLDLKDYARNQSLDTARALRLINHATDIVYAQMGIPSQEVEYNFYFDETQNTYPLPVDYIEPISLRYTNPKVMNWRGSDNWTWKPAEFLFNKLKHIWYGSKFWGHDASSGAWRLYVLAKNLVSALTFDTFDSNNAADWTATNDATNIRDDNVTFETGWGSLAFDIDSNVDHLATLTSYVQAMSISQYNGMGYFKVWLYLPNITNFTNVSFTWGSDHSNYFISTVTTQQDGSAFIVGWNQLSFSWATATQVGSPNLEMVGYIQFNFDYTAGYTGGTYFRLDYLRLVSLDQLTLTYYTAYKGTDSTGATKKQDFTLLTDLFTFPVFDISIRSLISLYAAILLDPSLIVDNSEYKAQYQFWTTTLGRRYPRKRQNNLIGEPKTRYG
jgi:hypothetical protein